MTYFLLRVKRPLLSLTSICLSLTQMNFGDVKVLLYKYKKAQNKSFQTTSWSFVLTRKGQEAETTPWNKSTFEVVPKLFNGFVGLLSTQPLSAATCAPMAAFLPSSRLTGFSGAVASPLDMRCHSTIFLPPILPDRSGGLPLKCGFSSTPSAFGAFGCQHCLFPEVQTVGLGHFLHRTGHVFHFLSYNGFQMPNVNPSRSACPVVSKVSLKNPTLRLHFTFQLLC